MELVFIRCRENYFEVNTLAFKPVQRTLQRAHLPAPLEWNYLQWTRDCFVSRVRQIEILRVNVSGEGGAHDFPEGVGVRLHHTLLQLLVLDEGGVCLIVHPVVNLQA